MSSLYDLTFTDEGYYFVNSSGDHYFVYLTEHVLLYPYGDDSEYINVFMLGFSCKYLEINNVRRFDERTKATLLSVFGRFLHRSPDEAFIYVCENKDGLGRNRGITFGKWFNEAGSEFERINSQIRYGDESLYTAILIKKGNIRRQIFIDAYHHTIQQLINKN